MRVKYLISLCIVALFSCDKDDDLSGRLSRGSSGPTWLIDESQVQDGGVGKDGIPALIMPELINPEDASYLSKDDLVVGYVYKGNARAYPHKILDWHEIINDEMGEHRFAITYCPLTGTASNWSRDVAGYSTTFGVSGKLFNSNLIPYDRTTESYWSQMRLDCVNGVLVGKDIPLFQAVETTWGTWQDLYPDTQVVFNQYWIYQKLRPVSL